MSISQTKTGMAAVIFGEQKQNCNQRSAVAKSRIQKQYPHRKEGFHRKRQFNAEALRQSAEAYALYRAGIRTL